MSMTTVQVPVAAIVASFHHDHCLLLRRFDFGTWGGTSSWQQDVFNRINRTKQRDSY